MLGAAQDAKRSPETGDLSLQVVMVAGAGFEPATFGPNPIQPDLNPIQPAPEDLAWPCAIDFDRTW